MNSPSQEKAMEIYTLGRFMVKRGDRVLTNDWQSSYRLWKLFKYLLTFRDNPKLPEEILETLWPGHSTDNPKHVLRNQIYRLRRLLSNDNGPEKAVIISAQGSYIINPDLDIFIDTEEFEKLVQEALRVQEEDPEQALDLHRRAFALYQGDYLPGLPYESWTMNSRMYFLNLYFKNIMGLTKILRDKGRYEKAKEVLLSALENDPLEEDFHLQYLEILLLEGKNGQARTYYNKATSYLSKELGIRPSQKMEELNERIRSVPSKKLESQNFKGLQMKLSTKGSHGAYYCEPETFISLYRLEERRMERREQTSLLLFLDLGLEGKKSNEAERNMENMKNILLRSLRKGDVFSRWGLFQFLILLSDTNEEKLDTITSRLETQFTRENPGVDMNFQIYSESL